MAYYANLGLEQAMPTRNVVLTDHQETMIESLVEAGRYQNASEVLREGLRLVETREAENAARLAALRAAAQIGIDAIDRGDYREFVDTDEMVAYLKRTTQDIITGSERD